MTVQSYNRNPPILAPALTYVNPEDLPQRYATAPQHYKIPMEKYNGVDADLTGLITNILEMISEYLEPIEIYRIRMLDRKFEVIMTGGVVWSLAAKRLGCNINLKKEKRAHPFEQVQDFLGEVNRNLLCFLQGNKYDFYKENEFVANELLLDKLRSAHVSTWSSSFHRTSFWIVQATLTSCYSSYLPAAEMYLRNVPDWLVLLDPDHECNSSNISNFFTIIDRIFKGQVALFENNENAIIIQKVIREVLLVKKIKVNFLHFSFASYKFSWQGPHQLENLKFFIELIPENSNEVFLHHIVKYAFIDDVNLTAFTICLEKIKNIKDKRKLFQAIEKQLSHFITLAVIRRSIQIYNILKKDLIDHLKKLDRAIDRQDEALRGFIPLISNSWSQPNANEYYSDAEAFNLFNITCDEEKLRKALEGRNTALKYWEKDKAIDVNKLMAQIPTLDQVKTEIYVIYDKVRAYINS